MPLRGLEEFRERERAKVHRRVEARMPGLLDVEFRVGHSVQFVYHGELRAGIVQRLVPGYIMTFDTDRQAVRKFKESEIEGRPSEAAGRDDEPTK